MRLYFTTDDFLCLGFLTEKERGHVAYYANQAIKRRGLVIYTRPSSLTYEQMDKVDETKEQLDGSGKT